MKLLRIVPILAVIVAAACLAAVISLHQPYAGFRGEALVDIPRGTGTFGVADLLADAGVVRSRWQFLLARALRPEATLQAGEYLFHEPASVVDVFERLIQGDVFYHELIVPEGHNIFDIAASVARLGIATEDEFLQAARDPAPIRDLAPQAPTLEGYLFPDTYRITRSATADQLCRMMTGRFRQAWAKLGADSPVHETVTLASLIEKETAVGEERPLVASVFRNRLRIGMALDCDPTAIYAALLENRYRGTLYRADLQSKHRFNTYQHPGLPPGPIANPGLDSLKAALHPAGTGYLYFVAKPDNSGAHVFSRKLEEHQEAVRNYRRGAPKNQTRTSEPVSRRNAAPKNRGDRVGRAGEAAGANF